MNFNFTDISSAFANMVQQDIPREFISDKDDTYFPKQQFAEKLSKILKKIEGSEEQTSLVSKLDFSKNNFKNDIESLLEKINKQHGKSFISKLQNMFLMLSNQDLKNASLEGEGLEALKKILLKAGFKESDINSLIAELSEGSENSEISLNDLFDKLFDLPKDTELFQEEDPGNYLEISTIPYLESLMNSLKIPHEKINEILTLAERGEKGLDFDFIISKLQGLQKESFYNGNQYKIQDNDENFRMLLKQLGIENQYSKDSSFTLTDLVDSLEKIRGKKAQQHDITPQASLVDRKNMGNEKSLDTLEALLKGLKIKNSESKTQVFEFSEGQIKNQFKNQLIAPEDDKMGKNGLFSLDHKNPKYKLDTAIQHGLKEVESMLDGKKSSLLVTKDQALDGKESFKQDKLEGTKILDKNQMASFNTKTGDTQPELNILKTKASFKNLPNFVTRQVSKNLVQAVNQGESSLRIQLKPPELGRLLITIDNTGSNIKINVITENSAAREILTSSVNELRTVLSNSGVNLERFEVDMSSDFRQSMADAKNQAGNFSKRNKNREKFLADSITKENINEPNGLLSVLEQTGSMHLVA